jgi:integrase
MILFGLYSGQRLGDIAKITWSNLDLEKGRLRLTVQKTHKVLIIPMAEPLIRHVEALPVSDDPSAPLHPRASCFLEAHGRTGGLSTQFAKLLAQAGLRPYQPHRSQGKGRGARRELCGLSFHSLRHTATTLLHEAGVPVAVVKELIGPSSPAVHEGYISCGEEALRKAADSLPDLS